MVASESIAMGSICVRGYKSFSAGWRAGLVVGVARIFFLLCF